MRDLHNFVNFFSEEISEASSPATLPHLAPIQTSNQAAGEAGREVWELMTIL